MKIIALSLVFMFAVSCTVPITGRKRINIVSDAEILPASFAQYEGFLKKIKFQQIKTNEIQMVGLNISKAVDKFMRANGMVSEANSYRWEFNLIEDPTVNAGVCPWKKWFFTQGIYIYDNTDGIAGSYNEVALNAL